MKSTKLQNVDNNEATLTENIATGKGTGNPNLRATRVKKERPLQESERMVARYFRVGTVRA